jgi:hypothetical protein
MKADVKDDEREGVHERKEEERVGGPSVKHLDLLMRDSRGKRNPICLARSRAV